MPYYDDGSSTPCFGHGAGGAAMAIESVVATGAALASGLLTPPAATSFPVARIVVRLLIAALIVVFLTYIVIEQVGSWRRRRSGRE